MIFEARLLVVCLAAFAVVSAVATTAVPLLIRWSGRRESRARARALFFARTVPAASGLAAAALAGLAFVLYEPRGHEPVGTTLFVSAAFAGALVAAGAWRFARALVATRRAMRRWLQSAVPVTLPGASTPAVAVESPFPVVAVAGLVHPRLVIARSVLEACPPDELAAILAHERYHIEQRDNLRRAVLVALPDLLATLPVSRRLVASWQDAEEEAADDNADVLGAGGRSHLAQALIRVARLAPAHASPDPLPASALYRGGSLERRIRRLVEPQSPEAGRRSAGLGAIAGLVALSALSAIEIVHQVVELAVTRLP